MAYDEGQHAQILHDAEPKAVYTDAGQRSFNTSRPLQVEAVADGRLHVRFYSPRALKGVLIRARFPSVSDEYLDLAYFDSIPAFADLKPTWQVKQPVKSHQLMLIGKSCRPSVMVGTFLSTFMAATQTSPMADRPVTGWGYVRCIVGRWWHSFSILRI